MNVSIHRNETALLIRLEGQGEIPTKLKPQYARGRVFLPKECKSWREEMAAAIHKQLGPMKDVDPVLKSATFTVVSNRWIPDLDTAYHQIQDMLTKVLFKIGDETVEHSHQFRFRLPEDTDPYYVVQAEFRLED